MPRAKYGNNRPRRERGKGEEENISGGGGKEVGGESQGLCILDRMVATVAPSQVPSPAWLPGHRSPAWCSSSWGTRGHPPPYLSASSACLREITSWLASRLGEEDQTAACSEALCPPRPPPASGPKMFTCHGFLEVASELEGSFRHLPFSLKNS